MAVTPAISAISISKTHFQNGKSTVVFRDFDFAAGTGEVTALMGPNGSGKTTLLNLIAGNIQPDNGCLEVLGGKPGDRPVGFVVQDYRATLLPWYTVQENIELPLRLREADQSLFGESIQRLLTDLHLETLPVERFPYELSGGQQQLVCILRAFAYSSKLLMLDEPTSALDASKQREVWNVLSALHEYSQPTTVLVTHDVDEALILGDRIVFLDGPPANVRIDVRNPIPSPRSISDLATPPMVELRRDILQMW